MSPNDQNEREALRGLRMIDDAEMQMKMHIQIFPPFVFIALPLWFILQLAKAVLKLFVRPELRK